MTDSFDKAYEEEAEEFNRRMDEHRKESEDKLLEQLFPEGPGNYRHNWDSDRTSKESFFISKEQFEAAIKDKDTFSLKPVDGFLPRSLESLKQVVDFVSLDPPLIHVLDAATLICKSSCSACAYLRQRELAINALKTLTEGHDDGKVHEA